MWFCLSFFPLLCHLGQFPFLSNFHSLLGFAFAVKSKAENRILCTITFKVNKVTLFTGHLKKKLIEENLVKHGFKRPQDVFLTANSNHVFFFLGLGNMVHSYMQST